MQRLQTERCCSRAGRQQASMCCARLHLEFDSIIRVQHKVS